ncbi:maleylpyruvate isomerase N-terminal domain-containing protein [Pedobacter glucosidilyticus]|uniref:maleylpyruvate isomerase N-terminal domain-containing protein n=1 Tax=Pedobacter glucosidilyticus TaxID=1122941 RepID=UPI0026E9501A|nr:maleylpyruvate isomerase N-terminal domain-containing protein [Pedobacter glucosidilyticus]
MTDFLPLFDPLNQALIDFLKQLNEKDWQRATVCKGWTVKDIVAHLLDTSIRRLSLGRDDYQHVQQEFATYEDLIAHINNLNKEWVAASKRLSPKILIELTSKYQDELIAYFKTLDPFDMALFPVTWAGKSHSENWFDIAREYSERWLHQQQIRFAFNNQEILDPKFYSPYLEIIMEALPYTYQKINAEIGKTVALEVVGPAGKRWTITKDKKFWIFDDENKEADALIYIDQQIAWLLFSKGIRAEEAGQFYQIHGERNLALPVLNMLTIMA